MTFLPELMNLELTTRCPLHCPQCYCTLTGGKDLALDTARYWLREGGKMGVKRVCLSGGETLCYSHLYEVVATAAEFCGEAMVALSGYHFTRDVLDSLIRANVNGIFISLNGSTEEINSRTRDGYGLALSALQLLHDRQFPNTYINWVMRSDNTDDFPQMIRLAEQYNVKYLVILTFKPDAHGELYNMPSKEQMFSVANFIRTYSGPVQIRVETCYSPLLALLSESPLLGNLNVSKYKGCGAGRFAFNVNVDGKLSPCRHLDYFESYGTLEEYWTQSPVLKQLRHVDDNPQAPCKECRYGPYCRHCLAINSKLHGRLYIGNETCGLYE